MNGRHVTRMTINDAFHYSAERRAELLASYPAHVRRARAMGLPAIGEGAVFPVDDDYLVVDDFPIPAHWLELGGLDFGYDHPTAAVRLVLDRESQIFYAVAEYRKSKEVPLVHVAHLKGWGPHIPFAWGLEGLQTKLSENPEQTQKMFRKHGLRMLDAHATFHDGGVGVERAVTEILELMLSGRLKFFRSCRLLLEEKNSYHRAKRNDDAVAQIVKKDDDLLDALRYAYMMIRFAVPVSWRSIHGGRPAPSRPQSRDPRDIFSR